MVPVGDGVEAGKAGGLVAGTGERERAGGAEEEFGVVGVFAHIPVDDLGGQEVEGAVVVDVGADGGAAVAAKAPGLAVCGVGPAEDIGGLGAGDEVWCRNAGAVFCGGVELAVAAGGLVVGPVEVSVVGVARGDGAIAEGGCIAVA